MTEKTDTTGTTTPETTTPPATPTPATPAATTETTTTETTPTKPTLAPKKASVKTGTTAKAKTTKTTAKKTTAPKTKKTSTSKAKTPKTPKAKKTTTPKVDRINRTPRLKEEAPTISEKLTRLVKEAKTGREKRRILALGLALKGTVSVEAFRAICVKMKCYSSANFQQDISKERDNGLLQDHREKVKGHRARRTGFSITAKGKKLAAEELKG